MKIFSVKAISYLFGVGYRTFLAILRADWPSLNVELKRLALLIVEGQAMRPERLALALKILEKEVDTLTFRRGTTVWTSFADDIAITPQLLIDGNWQGEEFNYLMAWLQSVGRLKPGYKTFIDIGANIGTTCIPIAQQTHLHVLAVEPIPENLKVLHENIVRNGLTDRITVVGSAVSAHASKLTMVNVPGNPAGAEVKVKGGKQGFGTASAEAKEWTVSCFSLDALAQRLEGSAREIALVWSDTQGFEHEILESGTTLWTAGVPFYVEVWPAALSAHGGVERFLRGVTEQFGTMILITRLAAKGIPPKSLPISEFPKFFEEVQGNGEDVLFLPKNFS